MTIKCEPTSRSALREYAYKIRKELGLEKELYFPIVEFLEIMPEIFQNFSFQIVEDNEMETYKHAETDVDNEIIYIKQSVYDGAYDGNGRDRFTIAHEIGHYLLLSVSKVKFSRTSLVPKVYEDPEWQANVFAGELLIPHHLIKRFKRPETIAKKCGVSISAASLQLQKKS